MTPNPSFEPTATGKPASAAQLKRFNVCLLNFLRPLSAVLTFRFGSKSADGVKLLKQFLKKFFERQRA